MKSKIFKVAALLAILLILLIAILIVRALMVESVQPDVEAAEKLSASSPGP